MGPILGPALVASATVAIFAPVYGVFAATATSDFAAVSGYAERLANGGAVVSPHFAFPLFVVGIRAALPELSFLQATWVAVTAAQVFTAVALFVLYGSLLPNGSWRSRATAAALALVTLLLGPINIWTLPQFNLHGGYFNPSNFHNPSSNTLKPLTLVLFFSFTRWVGGGGPAGLRRAGFVLGLALLHVLAILIKPSFSIFFVPVVCVVAAARWREGLAVDAWLVGVAYLLPLAVVSVPQYLVTYAGYLADFQRYIAVEPFAVVLKSTAGWLVPVKLLASVAFPLVALGLFWRDSRSRWELLVAWLGFLVAAAYAYLLVEGVAGTDQWGSGNFWWSVQAATFLLFVVSIRTVLRGWSEGRLRWEHPGGRLRLRCALGALALHLLGGGLWYVATLSGAMGVWL